MALLAATALLGACDPMARRDLEAFGVNGVLIDYRLELRCHKIALAPPNTSDTGSGPVEIQGPFLVYEFRSITNRGSAAAPFYFDSAKLFVQADNRGRRWGLHGTAPAASLTVAPGTEWTAGGRVILKAEHGLPADTALAYARGLSDPPVLLIARSPSPVVQPACLITDLRNRPNI